MRQDIFILSTCIYFFTCRDRTSDTVIQPVWKEEKYIVFESQLMKLFDQCPMCQQPTRGQISGRRGTYIKVSQLCRACHYNREWRSQPVLQKYAVGNLLLSAAILFSGANIQKTLRVLKAMGVASKTAGTFTSHQKDYLVPTIISSWKEEQDQLLQELKDMGGNLTLSGDGRSDSPGYSAKYGSYTFIESRVNKVIDMQLVQVCLTFSFPRTTIYIVLK